MNLSCGAGFVQLLMLLSGVSGIAIIFREQSRASLMRHNKTKIAAVGQRIMQEASNLKIKEQLRFLHRRGTLRKEISQGTAFLKNRIAALQSIRTSEKQFAYTVIIITLYGQYETFVERIIKEYLKEMHLDT